MAVCAGLLKGAACPCKPCHCLLSWALSRAMFCLSLLLRAENSCRTAFISKCCLLSGSVPVPIPPAAAFLWHFLAVYSTASLPNPHVAVTSCFPASSPAGESVRSSCNVFSHLTFLSCLDNFCSLARPASIFPKSGSASSSSPSLQLWNCAAGHDLMIQMWSAEVKLHIWLVRFG